jgi:hypothetical protein
MHWREALQQHMLCRALQTAVMAENCHCGKAHHQRASHAVIRACLYLVVKELIIACQVSASKAVILQRRESLQQHRLGRVLQAVSGPSARITDLDDAEEDMRKAIDEVSLLIT